MPAAAAAAEILLDGFELDEHLERGEIARDQRDRIGEVAARWPVRRIEQDWRRGEQAEVALQPCDGGFNDSAGPAEAAVRAVRADRNRVEGRGIRNNRKHRPS